MVEAQRRAAALDSDANVLLVGKIDQLFSEPRTRFYSERCLVAVILSLRLPDEAKKEKVGRHLWVLLWLKSLIESAEGGSKDLLIRLASHVLSHAPTADGESLALYLLQQLSDRQSIPISIVDVDIASNLSSWALLAGIQWATLVADALWRRWLDCMAATADAGQSSTTAAPADHPHTLFQILDVLLTEHSVFTDMRELDIQTAWKMYNLELLRELMTHLSDGALFSKILHWWQSQDQQHERQSKNDIASLLLYCLLNWVHSAVSRLPVLTNSAADILQLILACLIAPSEQSDDVRVLAWTCLASILNGSEGWEWLLHTTVARERWRPATAMLPRTDSSFRTILRLASGEFRIQLGRNEPQEDILSATSQVLVKGLEFLVLLMDSEDHDLDGDSILHLRFSFRESLDSCVQYLCLQQESIHCTQSLHVAVIVARVFASLLPDFLEFDHESPEMLKQSDNQHSAMDPHHQYQPIPVLSGLRAAMSQHQELDLQKELLPALRTVFAASEDDDARIQCLQDSDVLGIGFASFMSSFFGCHSNIEQVDLAAQVIEDWFDLVSTRSRQAVGVADLQASICGWIEAMLKNPVTDDEITMATALGSAVACYVTLQGETPPSDQHALILERALKYCSLVQSESGFV